MTAARASAVLLAAGALALTACTGPEPEERDVPTPPVVPPPAATPPDPTPAETAASTADAASIGELSLALEDVVELREPIATAVRPGSEEVWIAERGGRVHVLRDDAVVGQPVLDISDRTRAGGEQGLLGIAFSPAGDRFYTSYTDPGGDSHLDEHVVAADGTVDPAPRELLVVEQPYSNHNGGHVVTGPDGLLYLGFGDGGAGGDPEQRAQDLSTLLGKLLRLDPAGGDPYAVPADNPFVGRGDARPEIWAYGLRNPWRFAFDGGDLWIADVGQNELEEINRVPAGAAAVNYGWDVMEGDRLVEGDAPPPDHTAPVFTYRHDEGGCSVTGGMVYRGAALAGLGGAYLFGDFCDPRLRALVPAGSDVDLGVEVPGLVHIGADAAGEPLLLSLQGTVQRLVAS